MLVPVGCEDAPDDWEDASDCPQAVCTVPPGCTPDCPEGLDCVKPSPTTPDWDWLAPVYCPLLLEDCWIPPEEEAELAPGC